MVWTSVGEQRGVVVGYEKVLPQARMLPWMMILLLERGNGHPPPRTQDSGRVAHKVVQVPLGDSSMIMTSCTCLKFKHDTAMVWQKMRRNSQ